MPARRRPPAALPERRLPAAAPRIGAGLPGGACRCGRRRLRERGYPGAQRPSPETALRTSAGRRTSSGKRTGGGQPVEPGRADRPARTLAALERLLQRMGTPVVRQRPDADGQGLVSDTASRIANLSLPGRSAWLPPPLRAPPLRAPPWRQPAWPAMAGRSAWTGPTASTWMITATATPFCSGSTPSPLAPCRWITA